VFHRRKRTRITEVILNPYARIFHELQSDTRPPIRTEMRGQSLWIWIDREERRNAINKRGHIKGIESAVTVAQADRHPCEASF
jgi:hypothetical protein